ncbi:hypothetical protein ACFW04_013409 [Cataglyphis niger]
MISEFDGSPNKLQEFLSETTYAVENIDPLDEVTLLRAVLCTKLKGRAMLDFQMRKIRVFTQLKNELEFCYTSKKSTIHLQIEFNMLKQKSGESARTCGLKTDKLAMELYESMTEGRQHTVDNKAIMEIIQQQVLENFQIGLQNDIKTIIRKILWPRLPNTSQYMNRFPLSKPDRSSRVNTVNKYCNYCKKVGHDREECWSLHDRPNKDQSPLPKQYNLRPENKTYKK